MMNSHSFLHTQKKAITLNLGGILMKNETVIVTGGSSGMGKAMAQRFADEGANVVITGRDIEKLEAAKKKC